jgi:tetratricopeptide (TPR) repeat protein
MQEEAGFREVGVAAVGLVGWTAVSILPLSSPPRFPRNDPMPPTVSLCVIVRNEEANLPSCLESAASLVTETVVVDTGSTDATREVGRRLGARVHEFPWCDDFAAARNECLRHAGGDWIFWLDADDRLDEANRLRLRALFRDLPNENVAYLMKYVALDDGAPGRTSAVDHARLFRNHPQIRWEYRVHEQILPSVARLGGTTRPTDVVIYHLGYRDADVVRHKLERNGRLLELDFAAHPDDPVVLFNLGRTRLRLNRVAEAVPPLTRCLRALPSELEHILRTAYALLVEAHCRLSQNQGALAVCREGRGRYPDDLELLRGEGLVRLALGDAGDAETCLLQLLQRDPGNAAAQFHLARLQSIRIASNDSY